MQAVRETSEEIDGIDVRLGVVAAMLEVPCEYGCGWTYPTIAVRIQNTEASYLPTAQVASGHATWETTGLAWVPAEQVSGHPGIHPGPRAAWPTLRDAIRRGSGASDTR